MQDSITAVHIALDDVVEVRILVLQLAVNSQSKNGGNMAFNMDKIADWDDCPVCDGTGRVNGQVCDNCNGLSMILVPRS